MKTAAKRLLAGLLLLACLLLAAAGWWVKTGKSVLTGRHLLANNGVHIVVTADGTPVVLGDRSPSGALFDGLSDGDRVLVVCSGIAETYPAQSGAYWVLRLGGGAREDIPADTLRQLAGLHWLANTDAA